MASTMQCFTTLWATGDCVPVFYAGLLATVRYHGWMCWENQAVSSITCASCAAQDIYDGREEPVYANN